MPQLLVKWHMGFNTLHKGNGYTQVHYAILVLRMFEIFYLKKKSLNNTAAKEMLGR